MKIKIIFVLVLAVLTQSAFAHGGRTNSSGCHNNKKTGGYHCHNGSSKPSYTRSRSSSLSSSSSSSQTSKSTTYNTELIKNIQLLLISLDYKIEKADGVYSRETKRAIKHFQVDQELPVNGEPSEYLVTVLERANNL